MSSRPVDDPAPGAARSSPTYEEILANDSREVPTSLKTEVYQFLGDEPIAANRYTSQEFFQKEVENLWPRVWLMACREEEIPAVGDTFVYEFLHYSFLIVRSAPDEIRAYYNTCLHRGRKLRTQNGCVNRFRCPYHGFTWNLDGSLKEIPARWDFPHLRDNKMNLPEPKLDTWGGFIFINMDHNAVPLADYLSVMPNHFERWPQEDRYKSVHVAKVMKANWKAVAEAFMESYHVIDTHPQIMPYLADVNSQYCVYSDHVSRQISAFGEPSPHLNREDVSEQMIADAITGGGVEIPEGETARRFLAEGSRQILGAEDGRDYSDKSDAEMLDAILYNAFPNLSVWAGFSPNIVYRWTPIDPDSAVMEVMMLRAVPLEGPRPKPVPVHWLTEEEKWTDAEELSGLAPIFEQDVANLPHVQAGLKASGNGQIQLGNYQEVRIRLLHQTIDKYINGEL